MDGEHWVPIAKMRESPAPMTNCRELLAQTMATNLKMVKVLNENNLVNVELLSEIGRRLDHRIAERKSS